MSDKGYYGGVDAEAIHAGFEAERAELAERANRCQDKNGCFGSDPEATAMLVEFGDVGVTIGMERVAVAAHTAAIAGKPFETATFNELSYEGGRIGDGEPIALGSLTEDSWRARVGRCAFQCALNNSCPIAEIRAESLPS